MNYEISNRLMGLVKKQMLNDDQPVYADTTFKQIGFDSLDIVELVLAAEDEFAIEIADEEAEACETFGQAVELVESKILELP